MSTFYKSIIRPSLFLLSPDTAHSLASFGLRVTGKFETTKRMAKKVLSFDNPALETTVSGIKFSNPIGLPAGFDPNAGQAPVYNAIGFGFASIGSVTFHAQAGNPRPHFTRLIQDKSLIVNKGLMNNGAKAIADHIQELRAKKKIDYPLGISIARTSGIPDDQTAEDYAKSFRLLAPQADYIEINVSCPNIASFSPEKQVHHIRDILQSIDQARHPSKQYAVPIWVKLGPDTSDHWNEKIIATCLEYNVDAIILTNLVKDRSKLDIKSKGYEKRKGGISGKLLAPLAEEKLKFFYRHIKGKIPLISVGGIFTAEDAYRRIRLGASLTQILTGWIYEGPGTPKNINKGLIQLMKKDGFKNIAEAVGNTIG